MRNKLAQRGKRQGQTLQLSTYQRIWLQDDRNKVESKFETYCSTTVRCGHGQIRQCQRYLTSGLCTSNQTQNQNQCGTSLHNGEMAMARHCQCLKMEILSVHAAVQIHAKKFRFVTTSIELNEHDFWARCAMRMQGKQVPVQLDCR